jgi:hypothetical protein
MTPAANNPAAIRRIPERAVTIVFSMRAPFAVIYARRNLRFQRAVR